MPANLTPEFKAAEAKFKQAKTLDEKLQCLQEMLRTIPKHKGTEKMRADIKRRISKTKDSIEQSQSGGKKGISYHVPAEGAAQCTLVGPPNSGKSSIIANFTNAPATVAEYPYTTMFPQPAMLEYENIQFQLIDLPAISNDFLEPWVISLIRVSDMILLVVGLDDIAPLETVIHLLNNHKIYLTDHYLDASYHDSIVKLPTVIIANKLDDNDADIALELLRDEFTDLPILPISTQHPNDAQKIGSHLYESLHLVRFYTQPPGKKPSFDKPVVIRKGDTLIDAAREIHKDFANELKFARVWGEKTFDGQRVHRDYEIQEGDIIEFKI